MLKSILTFCPMIYSDMLLPWDGNMLLLCIHGMLSRMGIGCMRRNGLLREKIIRVVPTAGGMPGQTLLSAEIEADCSG